MINPLLASVLGWLKATKLPATEYSLIQYLDMDLPCWPFDPETDAQLVLFRKHFLVMNALYALERTLRAQGFLLVIDPLAIALHPVQKCAVQASMCRELGDSSGINQALADYYLDWTNFQDANSDSVERLLNRFWSMYQCADHVHDARKILQVDAAADWDAIRLAYRRLARQFHPDVGGDPQLFIEIRQAYEVLRIACHD